MNKTITTVIISLLMFGIGQCYSNNLSSTNAINNKNFTLVQQRLSNVKTISGDFIQTRHIAILSEPLISKGTFVLSKQNGLKWIQTTPFPSRLELTNTKLVEKMGDNPESTITKDKQPIIFAFTNVFLSIFKGNTKSLIQYFSVQFKGNPKQWTMTLTPKGSPLNKAIVSFKLYGSKCVNKVVIKEVKNNMQTIQFNNIHEPR